MSILTAYDKFIQQALKYGFSLWGTAKTGQTIWLRTGDDGHLEKGYPKAPPRFKDNGDGTITDNATGLMWVKQPENIGGVWVSGGQPVQRPWNDAIDDSWALDYAGHTDWRLPNIRELVSIADYGEYNPAINETFFPNTKSGKYWSSTARDVLNSHKWLCNFTEGRVDTDGGLAPHYVRPVRLGVPKD